jgi:hypothetical protein
MQGGRLCDMCLYPQKGKLWRSSHIFWQESSHSTRKPSTNCVRRALLSTRIAHQSMKFANLIWSLATVAHVQQRAGRQYCSCKGLQRPKSVRSRSQDITICAFHNNKRAEWRQPPSKSTTCLSKKKWSIWAFHEWRIPESTSKMVEVRILSPIRECWLFCVG